MIKSHRYLASCLSLFLMLTAASASAEITWKRHPEATINAARRSGKPILVFVSATWCHYCEKMKRETWQDPRIDATVSSQFETLLLDGDRDAAVVKKLGLRGFPATLIYTADGEFVTQRGGYFPPEAALAWLGSLQR